MLFTFDSMMTCCEIISVRDPSGCEDSASFSRWFIAAVVLHVSAYAKFLMVFIWNDIAWSKNKPENPFLVSSALEWKWKVECSAMNFQDLSNLQRAKARKNISIKWNFTPKLKPNDKYINKIKRKEKELNRWYVSCAYVCRLPSSLVCRDAVQI